MKDHHPRLQASDRMLCPGAANAMPILGAQKVFYTWNESTVCTVELADVGGSKRGAIAVGFSNHDLNHGVATFSSIDEARAMVALLQNAIADAERIERGEVPIALDMNAPGGTVLQ